MRISLDDVKLTATLARLELGDVELARMQRELDAILGYMEKLAALDLDGVEPMTHAVATPMPLREDRVGQHLTVEQALAGAPRRDGDSFEVPRVIKPAGGGAAG